MHFFRIHTNQFRTGYKFEAPVEAPPPTVDDEVRRREEEELQRVLEMSVQDKGGRAQPAWAAYSSANAAGSTSSNAPKKTTTAPTTTTPASAIAYQGPSPASGYVRAQTPPPQQQYSAAPAPVPVRQESLPHAPTPARQESIASPVRQDSIPSAQEASVVTRVRALYTFEPSESGELAFEKGDVIKVVDRGYKDWWRGQLRGRTGIFPVNYVVRIPSFLMDIDNN